MDPPGSVAILRVGVGVVIADDQRAVLACLRREADYYGGYWEFPGGKFETDESPEQCVVRELREELGIEVTPIKRLPVIEHYYADRGRRVLLHPHLCKLQSGQPKAIEVAEFRWCNAVELQQLRFLPANGPLIQAVFQHLHPKT